jgi:hypothetical protein
VLASKRLVCHWKMGSYRKSEGLSAPAKSI